MYRNLTIPLWFRATSEKTKVHINLSKIVGLQLNLYSTVDNKQISRESPPFCTWQWPFIYDCNEYNIIISQKTLKQEKETTTQSIGCARCMEHYGPSRSCLCRTSHLTTNPQYWYCSIDILLTKTPTANGANKYFPTNQGQKAQY